MTAEPDGMAVLRGSSERILEAHERARFERARSAYQAAGLPTLGRCAVAVDRIPFPGMWPALTDPRAEFHSVEIAISDAAPAGPAWEFLRPFTRLLLDEDGSVEVAPRHGAPERAIARVLPREGFGTIPTGSDFGPGRLPTLARFCRAVREGGYVPFGIALEVYSSLERLRYEFDLVGGRLLADPRAGHLSPLGRLRRSARAAWNFDRVLSGANLPAESARVLEVIWESGTASESTLASVFGAVHGGPEAIRRLARLRLIEAEPEAGGWRVREGIFGRASRGGAAPAPSRVPQTALRHSMGELLAGAEARATCPMCGEEVPPGHKGLLCDRCTREVQGASPVN
ncbi:MAG TPA: hypothetical protein VGX00_02965 [Thermoplasmata archaeon]|nr:hypothetical protein [Thermoplasmata archaeon]